MSKQTPQTGLTSLQIDPRLNRFLTLQALSSTEPIQKRDFVRGIIIEGLKARNIEIPSDIMNTR